MQHMTYGPLLCSKINFLILAWWTLKGALLRQRYSNKQANTIMLHARSTCELGSDQIPSPVLASMSVRIQGRTANIHVYMYIYTYKHLSLYNIVYINMYYTTCIYICTFIIYIHIYICICQTSLRQHKLADETPRSVKVTRKLAWAGHLSKRTFGSI